MMISNKINGIYYNYYTIANVSTASTCCTYRMEAVGTLEAVVCSRGNDLDRKCQGQISCVPTSCVISALEKGQQDTKYEKVR